MHSVTDSIARKGIGARTVHREEACRGGEGPRAALKGVPARTQSALGEGSRGSEGCSEGCAGLSCVCRVRCTRRSSAVLSPHQCLQASKNLPATKEAQITPRLRGPRPWGHPGAAHMPPAPMSFWTRLSRRSGPVLGPVLSLPVSRFPATLGPVSPPTLPLHRSVFGEMCL